MGRPTIPYSCSATCRAAGVPCRPRRAGREELRQSDEVVGSHGEGELLGSVRQPIERCGEIESACEACGGLVVACGESAPFLEPGPEVLHTVSAAIGRLVEMLMPGMRRVLSHHRLTACLLHESKPCGRGVRAVADYAADAAQQGGIDQQAWCCAQLGGLARDQGKVQRSAGAVADRARLRSVAASRPPERLGRGPPFLAPAAFWCARTEVPSKNTSPSAGWPASRRYAKARCQTPILDQRMCNCAAFHQGPSSGGTERHFVPLRCRQTTASTVRRSSTKGRPVPDLAISSADFSRAQSLSLRICIPRQPTNDPAVL